MSMFIDQGEKHMPQEWIGQKGAGNITHAVTTHSTGARVTAPPIFCGGHSGGAAMKDAAAAARRAVEGELVILEGDIARAQRQGASLPAGRTVYYGAVMEKE